MRAPSSHLEQLLPVVLLLLCAVLPFIVPGYYVQFATKVLLIGLAAMALNLVVGFGGLVSMCHAAFFGISGYILAVMSDKYDPASVAITFPLAILAASFAAVVIGALSLRTRGVYFIMVTLAFGEMLFFFFHDTTFFGGSDGAFIYFKPELRVFGWRPFDLEKNNQFYWVVLGLTVLGTLLLQRIIASPFGHALQAARDNERRARSIGFPVYRIRLIAFVISGAIAGVAGYFSAAQYGFIAPQVLSWHLSAILLVCVVLGGMGTVTGPLLGAVVLLGLEEVLKSYTSYWKLIEGLIIIFIVLAVPGGVRQLFDMLVPQKEDAPRETSNG